MKAIQYRHYHAVELLLKLGADPNKRTKYCKEPLYWTLTTDRLDIYDLLLRYGAIETSDIKCGRLLCL